jgi:hypothetical protein
MSTDNSLGYHIQMVLPKGSGKTSATKLQQRLHARGKVVSIRDIRKELDLMLQAGLVSYSDSIHGQPERWGQPRRKRDPLPEGHGRRMTDARCAWRKMTGQQRGEFLTWIQETEEESPITWHTNSIVIAVTEVK